jgi:hypothetical protein
MNVTDPKQVSAILKECDLEHSSIEPLSGLSTGGFRVEVIRGMYDEASWSYDNLAKAAALLGTTDISFQWNLGWGGTEVTPGDPPEFYVYIGAATRR